KALANLMKGRTTFVIAHRLSTIRNADRIIVLSEGAIKETGRHDELLGAGGEYSRLYSIQFKS
ncbi:partial putative multidrug resistance ABC transporter ATP-binding/permease protein YheH, partial [Anaerolineae bacterium]